MKFTEEENNLLNCLNKYWKYIARDKDGTLYLFRDNPVKETDYYNSEGNYICIDTIVSNDLFKCVTFDGGPVRISKEILDDAEKRYLKGVIRPFKDQARIIVKYASMNGRGEYIVIYTDECRMVFPEFEAGTMYKGMKPGHGYSIEELGL